MKLSNISGYSVTIRHNLPGSLCIRLAVGAPTPHPLFFDIKFELKTKKRVSKLIYNQSSTNLCDHTNFKNTLGWRNLRTRAWNEHKLTTKFMRIQNDDPTLGKKRSSQTRVGFFLYRDASGELREWQEIWNNENGPRLLVNCISTLLIKTSFRVVSVNIWRLLKKREGSCRKRTNQTKCEIGLKLISKPFLFATLNKYW